MRKLNKKRLRAKWLRNNYVGSVHRCRDIVWIVLPIGNVLLNPLGGYKNKNGRVYSEEAFLKALNLG